MLTRLLEDRLIRSAPSRVVTLSSVTHRFGTIGNPRTFLADWNQGSWYENSKLGNALFAFELNRRLAPLGVCSSAVDPGGVASSIWRDSIFSRPPLKFFIENLYAPISDGAAVVVHAATVDWKEDAARAAIVNARWAQPGDNQKTDASEHEDVHDYSSASRNDPRYYARGTFAWPTVTSVRVGVPSNGPTSPSSNISLIDRTRGAVFAVSTLLHSAVDWPLRRFSGGKLASKIQPVPANPQCYDVDLSKTLWEVSADACGLSAWRCSCSADVTRDR